LSVSGQLFVGGALLGILIVSIAGIRGAIPTLMPQPIGGFARLIMEKGIPVTEFPIEVIYLFGLGLPIAYALVMIQILWRGPESKNLLWILGAFGIASLGSWPFLPARSADLVLLGQLLALPGLAINSLAFGIVCVLLDCRMRALGTSRNIPTTDVDQADTSGTYC